MIRNLKRRKALFLASTLVALSFGITSWASAAVVSSFSVSRTSILEGEGIGLDFHLAIDDGLPHLGGQEFVNGITGKVTLFSGAPDSLGVFEFPSISRICFIDRFATAQDFSAVFFYPSVIETVVTPRKLTPKTQFGEITQNGSEIGVP